MEKLADRIKRRRDTFENLEAGLGLISAAAAKATIQVQLTAHSNANYFTGNPVLYPVGKYFAWIVPYYSRESSMGNVHFQGIGIVDAQNSAHYVALQSKYKSSGQTGLSETITNAVSNFLGSHKIQDRFDRRIVYRSKSNFISSTTIDDEDGDEYKQKVKQGSDLLFQGKIDTEEEFFSIVGERTSKEERIYRAVLEMRNQIRFRGTSR